MAMQPLWVDQKTTLYNRTILEHPAGKNITQQRRKRASFQKLQVMKFCRHKLVNKETHLSREYTKWPQLPSQHHKSPTQIRYQIQLRSQSGS